MNWKFTDATNQVVYRVLESGAMESCLVSAPEFQAWLSAGNTPEPADPVPLPSAKEQIYALERESMIPRVTREFMLAQAVMTASAQGIDEPTLYANNIGYRKLKDLDNQIIALRSQIL